MVPSKRKSRAALGTGKEKVGSPSFSPEVFLATAGVGRKLVKYAKKKMMLANFGKEGRPEAIPR